MNHSITAVPVEGSPSAILKSRQMAKEFDTISGTSETHAPIGTGKADKLFLGWANRLKLVAGALEWNDSRKLDQSAVCNRFCILVVVTYHRQR